MKSLGMTPSGVSGAAATDPASSGGVAGGVESAPSPNKISGKRPKGGVFGSARYTFNAYYRSCFVSSSPAIVDTAWL